MPVVHTANNFARQSKLGPVLSGRPSGRPRVDTTTVEAREPRMEITTTREEAVPSTNQEGQNQSTARCKATTNASACGGTSPHGHSGHGYSAHVYSAHIDQVDGWAACSLRAVYVKRKCSQGEELRRAQHPQGMHAAFASEEQQMGGRLAHASKPTRGRRICSNPYPFWLKP